MIHRLERYFQQVWYGGKKPPFVLTPLEKLYHRVVTKKREKFLLGSIVPYTPKAPVIVVGNITVGGTGKTPLTLFLVEAFKKRGISVGIISRGYGGSAKNYPVDVSKDALSAEVGDEPLMMHLRSGVPVVVDPDRVSAAKHLESHHSVDIIISDDGLQHYALNRSIEIVVMDATRGVGNGRCLPNGPLREPVARLSSVDFLVVNGGDISTLKPEVKRVLGAEGQCYSMMIEAEGIVSLENAEGDVTGKASGKRGGITPGEEVYGVAGIGNPDRFFTTLREAGYRVVEKPFADHYQYQLADFNAMIDKPIVMTEKDAVKVASLNIPNSWYLKVSASINSTLIDDILREIKTTHSL